MILLDVNQAIYATFFASIGKHTNIKIEEPLIRHMTLNMIRNINVRFRNQYGKLIICNDSARNWRKNFFPFYKASRKKSREQSELDWTAIFASMNNIKTELKTVFPYKFIEVDMAEADDIIGTICSEVRTEPILIVSGDKDYRQLHREGVKQYDPVNSKYIDEPDPKKYLFLHILKGDTSDGIPNIASPDNCFVINQRQKNMTKKLIDELSSTQIDENNKYYRNYTRNKTLIDLSEIPENIKFNIMEQYNVIHDKDKSGLLDYFSKNRLKQLVEQINDF